MLRFCSCFGCYRIAQLFFFFFFFNDTPPTEISPLPLHAPLPIGRAENPVEARARHWSTPTAATARTGTPSSTTRRDRKSTRLNSSHSQISYAVFCLKKKKRKKQTTAPGTGPPSPEFAAIVV